jgi:hypothetical protein
VHRKLFIKAGGIADSGISETEERGRMKRRKEMEKNFILSGFMAFLSHSVSSICTKRLKLNEKK